MPSPTVVIERATNPPPRATLSDTGLALVTVLSERGPDDAVVEVRNLDAYVDAFGDRQTTSGAYDWIETFFREGGARALVSRRVGPAPVRASKALSDGSGTAVTVRAKEPGSFANTWTVAVSTSGGSSTYTIAGTDGDGSAFTEVWGPYATVAEAVAADPSDRVEFVLGTGVDPVTAAAAAMTTTTGTDDRASITQTQIDAARDRFSDEYGPGQLADVDLTTTANHSAAMAHAELNGRVALLDYADTATAATLLTALATDRADTNAESGLPYVNWLTAPPLTGTTTERTVPPSALIAGLAARNDGSGLSPNEPIAGKNGRARWLTGLTQAAWDSDDADDLADAGGNIIKDRLSTGVTVWGARTVADPDTARWVWASNARFFTLLRSGAGEIAEEYVLGKLNSRRIAAGQSALAGFLARYYPDDLTGDTMADAFNVDASENTDATMEAGELIYTLSLHIAGVAETVRIRIVKVAQTESVA